MNIISSKGPVFDPGLCRCCGTMRKCRLLTVEYESVSGKEVYSDMFMDCFGLLLSYLDGKPTERLICAVCVRRLRECILFKKQVLQCEETFLRIRMSEAKCTETLVHDATSGAGKIEVEVELVKEEPVSPTAAGGGDRDDDDGDDDDRMDTESREELKPEPLDTPQTSVQVKRPVMRPLVKKPIPSAVRKIPISMLVRKHTQHLKKSSSIPMSRRQQLIRERDTSYMVLTNTMTVIEYSYVCPFRCRHNNLICYYCGTADAFTDPELLRQHTEREHNPSHFKISERYNTIKTDISRIDCRLCSEKIDNLEDFKTHITAVHKKVYYFEHKDTLLPFKLAKDEQQCLLCELRFPFFHALNKHMNEHFSNFVCETCGLGFVDHNRFMMHQQRHDQETNYPCPECGKNFKARYNVELHIDRVHKKRGRVYCPKCDVTLMTYPQKLKHLVEVHGEAPLTFPCTMCDRVCDSRRSLTLHKRKDHYKDYRHECQICGQKFFTKFALTNHMPTHTGERNYKCKVCDKSYPRLKTLKEHTRIHNNDRRYRCHVCGQAFIQNCSLKGHMKSQHPEYG